MVQKLPGLSVESLPKGGVRVRVSAVSGGRRRTTIPVGPGHPDFAAFYEAARRGDRQTGKAKLVKPTEYEVSLGSRAARAIFDDMLKKARARASLKNIPFGLTVGDIMDQLHRQSHVCAMSGAEFDMTPNGKGKRKPRRPSIDRINNSGGYTAGNVRLVTTIVNIGRGDWSDDDFIASCRAVASRNMGQ